MTVYRLMITNTNDKYVYKSLEKKQNINNFLKNLKEKSKKN